MLSDRKQGKYQRNAKYFIRNKQLIAFLFFIDELLAGGAEASGASGGFFEGVRFREDGLDAFDDA